MDAVISILRNIEETQLKRTSFLLTVDFPR
jgi:hypothetical protein